MPMSLSHFLIRRLVAVLGLWLLLCLGLLSLMGNKAVKDEYANAQTLVGQIQRALVTHQPLTESDLAGIQSSLAQSKANMERQETRQELIVVAMMLVAMAIAGGAVVWFNLRIALGNPLDHLVRWLQAYEQDARQGKRLQESIPELQLRELQAMREGINSLITTLEHEQDRGKDLLNQIMKVQETERQAIAQDLHDHLGQMLTSISVNSAALGKRTSGALEETAHAIQNSAQEMMAWLRGSLKELKPHLLLEVSLREAALDLTENWAKRRGWFVDFAWADSVSEMPEDRGIQVFRILQEALTNAARHSTRKGIKVVAGENPDSGEFLLIIENDCEESLRMIQPSLGLVGARQRAEAIGGSLDWSAQKGTYRLLLTLPNHAREHKA